MNPLERINRKLKDKCSTGHISFHKCCRTLHAFKTDYIRFLHFPVDAKINSETSVTLISKSLATTYKIAEVRLQNLVMRKFSKFLTSENYLILIANRPFV